MGDKSRVNMDRLYRAFQATIKTLTLTVNEMGNQYRILGREDIYGLPL